jgi:hypothetical protein
MAWIKCPYSRCRYSWDSRTDSPKRCPKCTGRLDTPSRWRVPEGTAPPAQPSTAEMEG